MKALHLDFDSTMEPKSHLGYHDNRAATMSNILSTVRINLK